MSKDISKLLATNDVIATETTSFGKTKSDVWRQFRYLVYNNGGNYTGYVLCMQCNKPIKHDKALSGTTHLRNHLSSCSENPTARARASPKLTGYFKKFDVPKPTKEKVACAAMAFAAIDVRPLKAIEGKGFMKLADVLIDVGAKHGKVDAKTVLPDRNTLKRKIVTTADDVRKKVVAEVRDAIRKNGFIGMTTDMWTDVKCRHFVSITVHYVADAELRSHTLTVYEFEGKNSGENIRTSITNTCRLLSLPLHSLVSKVFFVSDNGSNIKLALSDFNRIPCACHMVATVLHHTLQLQSLSKTVEAISETSIEMGHVSRIRELISSVKSITGYVKRTGLNNGLPTGLKQSVDTRWNSTLTMLKSFSAAQNSLPLILQGSPHEERLRNVDWVLLGTLVVFLQPFSDVTQRLEGDQNPTIHRVYQCFHALEVSMAPSITDCQILQFLKKRGLACLNAKFEICDIHLLAFFLNPIYKSLVPFSVCKREQIHSMARSFLKEFTAQQDIHDSAEDGASSSGCATGSVLVGHTYEQPGASTKKLKSRSFDDDFLHWQEISPSSPTDEVEEYIKCTLDDSVLGDAIDADSSILTYWTNTATVSKFPKLSRLAIGVLSIPASSASSERAFSLCGNTIDKKRSVLSANTLDSLVVLKCAGERFLH